MSTTIDFTSDADSSQASARDALKQARRIIDTALAGSRDLRPGDLDEIVRLVMEAGGDARACLAYRRVAAEVSR